VNVTLGNDLWVRACAPLTYVRFVLWNRRNPATPDVATPRTFDAKSMNVCLIKIQIINETLVP